ncbi:MAG: O-antigen ligase family protein [Kiritimatiellae bacterium]|nr:O-antigen ligase family protein [Kiritimatiellia bacterium]
MIVLAGAVVIIGPWLLGLNRPFSLAPALILLGVCGVLSAILLWRYPEPTGTGLPPSTGVWLLFLAYVGIWTRFGIPYDSDLQLARFSGLLLLFWILSQWGARGDRWKWLLGLLLLSVSIMAWYAVILNARGSNMILWLMERPDDYGMRASGAFVCPNHFAQMLGLFLPLSLVLAVYRGCGLPLRILGGYTFLVSLYPLLLTQSRAGWIGALVGIGLAVWLMASRKGMRHAILAALILLAAFAGVGFTLWHTSEIVRARVEKTMKGDVRLQLWQDTLDLIQDHPVLGSGPGSFRFAYHDYQHVMKNYLDPEFAHNEYLHFTAELGGVGITLAALAWGVLMIALTRRFWKADRDRDRVLLGGGLAALAGTLAHAAFDFQFNIYGNAVLIITVAGLVCGVTAPIRSDRERKAGAARLTALLALLLSAYVLVTGVRYWGVTRVLAGADAATRSLSSADAEQLFSRARFWYASNWRIALREADYLRKRSAWNRNPEMRERQLNEAEALYQQVLRANPWEVNARYGLSGLLWIRGEQEQALDIRLRLAEQRPFDAFLQAEAAVALDMMGRTREAIPYMEKAWILARDETYRKELNKLKAKAKHAAPAG